MVSSGHAGAERGDAVLPRDASNEPAAFTELYAGQPATVHACLWARIEWAASDPTAVTFARPACHGRGRAVSGSGRVGALVVAGIAANLLAMPRATIRSGPHP
jgi:hypothetical protein